MSNRIFKQIIDDLLIGEKVKSNRLKFLEEQNITIDKSPKIIILDLIKTSELEMKENIKLEDIINRELEIEFDDEFIIDRDISIILLDYMKDKNNKLKHKYCKELEKIAFSQNKHVK